MGPETRDPPFGALLVPIDTTSEGGIILPQPATSGPMIFGPTEVPTNAAMSPFMRHLGTYLTVDDYMSPSAAEVVGDALGEAVVSYVLRYVDQTNLLLGLAYVASAQGKPEPTAKVIEELHRLLNPQARERLDNAIRPGRPDTREPIVRQTVLGAFRRVLTAGSSQDGDFGPRVAAAVHLTHAIASGFNSEAPTSTETFGGLPGEVAVDLVANQTFHSPMDVYATVSRTMNIWNRWGDHVRPLLDGRTPADLLLEATGLELEDLLAFGFAAWCHFANLSVGKPCLLNKILHPEVDAEKWGRFVQLLSLTPEETALGLASPRSNWDYLAFESKPILELEGGLLVIDGTFLIKRVTSGLFWYVHDQERARGGAARMRWTQAYGDMMESYAESILEPMAPPVIGASDTTWFTEDDLGAAYPETKRADAAIDFGTTVCVFEVVTHQLTVSTRIEVDLSSFKADLKVAIYKKAKQLHETCENLSTDLRPLTGDARTDVQVVPVLIVAGTFPVNDVTTAEIERHCRDEGWFEHARIQSLAVIDIEELEMLEAMWERGHSIVDLVVGWKTSDAGGMSLRNWLIDTSGVDAMRPNRIQVEGEGAIQSLYERLNFAAPWTGFTK
jgi:hypothetical protein